MQPLYAQYNVLPLSNLITLQQATFMYSYHKNLLPTALQTYFSEPSHRYSTRYSRTNYILPPLSAKVGKTSMKEIGPKIWAEVPSDLKSLAFRKNFSKALKKSFLDKIPKGKPYTQKFSRKPSKTDNSLQRIFDLDDSCENFLGFEISLELFLTLAKKYRFFYRTFLPILNAL